eukprot:6191005-Pleurochrysis_carterae.AAC.1
MYALKLRARAIGGTTVVYFQAEPACSSPCSASREHAAHAGVPSLIPTAPYAGYYTPSGKSWYLTQEHPYCF